MSHRSSERLFSTNAGRSSVRILLILATFARLSLRSFASRPQEVDTLALTHAGYLQRANDTEQTDNTEHEVEADEAEPMENEADPGEIDDINLQDVADNTGPDVHNKNAENSVHLPDVIGYTWQKGKQLGHGSFGEVWEALSPEGSIPHPVVLKMEKANAKKHELDKEASVFRHLQGGEGIPKFHQFVDNEGMPNRHRFLIMEKLGMNLEKYRQHCGGHLSEPIILKLALQMIDRFKHAHDRYVIYRDTKPENFMLGWDHEGQHFTNTVHLIDFGLASTYWDNTYKVHKPQKGPNGERTSFVGTQRYASVDALSRLQQSRKDDMETLAYVLGHLYTGALPWSGMSAKEFDGDQKEKKLAMLKKQVKMRSAAEAHGWKYIEDKPVKGHSYKKYAGDDMFPEAIKDYLNSVRALSYEDAPDYARYKDQISESLASQTTGAPSGLVEFNHGTKTYELQC